MILQLYQEDGTTIFASTKAPSTEPLEAPLKNGDPTGQRRSSASGTAVVAGRCRRGSSTSGLFGGCDRSYSQYSG